METDKGNKDELGQTDEFYKRWLYSKWQQPKYVHPDEIIKAADAYIQKRQKAQGKKSKDNDGEYESYVKVSFTGFLLFSGITWREFRMYKAIDEDWERACDFVRLVIENFYEEKLLGRYTFQGASWFLERNGDESWRLVARSKVEQEVTASVSVTSVKVELVEPEKKDEQKGE